MMTHSADPRMRRRLVIDALPVRWATVVAIMALVWLLGLSVLFGQTFSGASLSGVIVDPPPPVVAPLSTGDYGYQPRACGFDLDDDGIVGEAVDDCRVCDADVVGGNVSGGTADPDGDLTNEDLIYVDCDSGTNQAGCGADGQPPCLTLTYAIDNEWDGPGDGAEDIICFTGTCGSEGSQLDFPSGGVTTVTSGFWTKAASGSQVRDWQYPNNPAMFVGWDRDRDGEYPPFDTDDTSVLHANVDEVLDLDGMERCFSMHAGASDNSFFELAHFTAKECGHDSTDDEVGGFMALNGGAQAGRSHVYQHDMSVQGTNKLNSGATENILYRFFGISDAGWYSWENMEFPETGGYGWRGNGSLTGPTDAGPFRVQNISGTSLGCDTTGGPNECPDNPGDAFMTWFKVWGFVADFEVLNSRLDGNTDNWQPSVLFGAAGVGPSQCSQEWDIRHNLFENLKTSVNVQGSAGGVCGVRPVDGIRVDGNLAIVDQFDSGNRFASVSGGTTATDTAGSITYTNNMVQAEVEMDSCFSIRSGNDGGANPGTITIVGNTCSGDVRNGHVHVRGGLYAFEEQDFEVHNNIFDGPAGGDNYDVDYAPSGWVADTNALDPDLGYEWNASQQADLAAWRTSSGGDATSSECEALFFTSQLTGELRLSPFDTCAIGNGTDIVTHSDVDLDGIARPLGAAVDIGAEEIRQCVQVIGFSQTCIPGWCLQFEDEPGIGDANVEMLFQGGVSLPGWDDPGFVGWSNAIASACTNHSGDPGYVLFTFSGGCSDDPAVWETRLDDVDSPADCRATETCSTWNLRNTILGEYPNVKRIWLQPVVGADVAVDPDELCPMTGAAKNTTTRCDQDAGDGFANIRATSSHPAMDTAAANVSSLYDDVWLGFSPVVDACSDYTGDGVGHMTSGGYNAVAIDIGAHYSSGGG